MSPVLLLVTTVVLAFVLGRVVAPWTSRAFGTSHIEFIVAGALFGPSGLIVVFEPAFLAELRPFIALLLGMIAFLVGLRLRSVLGHLELFSIGFAGGVLVALLVGVACMFVLEVEVGLASQDGALFDRPFYTDHENLWSLRLHSEVLWWGLGLGSAAAVAGAAIFTWARKSGLASEDNATRLSIISTSSHVAAIMLCGFALAGNRASESAGALGLTVTEWAVISLGAGGICGLLFGLFIGDEADEKRIQLATVGAIIFASGVGEGLDVSPLWVNLTAGAVIGLTSQHAEKVRESLESLHEPLLILIMLFAGMSWTAPPMWGWSLAGLFVVSRLIARRASIWLSVNTLMGRQAWSPSLGNAFVTQGALAAAICIALTQHNPMLAPVISSVILVSIVASQLAGRRALRGYLLDIQGAPESVNAAMPAAVEAVAEIPHLSITDDAQHVITTSEENV